MDKPNNKGLRKFPITTWAVDNATSVFILTVMILLFGIQSYDDMPKEQYPEITMPQVFVNTVYFGNSASDIENLVTRPIEKELQSITGIKNVISTSMSDFSAITAEFEADEDIDDAIRKVKDAVDKAKTDLPNDLTEEPEIIEFNFADFPIMAVNISGNFAMDELRGYAEYLEDEIEALDEISKVNIKGALEREVKIDMDLHKMQSLQINFQDVENAISAENITMSGGELLANEFRRAIRIVGEFTNMTQIENVIVKSENQRPIFLKDIATVTYGFEQRSSYARSDGLPVVSLDVIKRKGKNLLHAADEIRTVVAEAEDKIFPEDLKVSIFNDQSIYTRDAVSNLENSIISGVILVVIILLFFLGFRNAGFVGMAIPLSMLMGILILNITGTTMNIVVLFSLILALGLLVDNAIVVVENIFRYMQNGYSRYEAAKFGAGEVAVPIIASTATTLAAFAPLAFWPGIMGEFMKFMPLTLIIVLASSLFVALVINPVLTSVFMRLDEKGNSAETNRRKRRNILIGFGVLFLGALAAHLGKVVWLGNLLGLAAILTVINYFLLRPASFYFQNRVIPVMERIYDKFIRGALKGRMPIGVFLGTFVLMFFAIGLLVLNAPKTEFFPIADPVYVNAFVELSNGKDIEATNRLMKELEEKIEEAIAPYSVIVDAVLSQIGENTTDPNSPPEYGVTPHKARLTVSFVPAQDRGDISTFEVMEKMRASVGRYPGVQITIDQNQDGPPTGKPINMEVQGENIDELAVLTSDLITYINSKNIPGIEELKADVTLNKPEMIVHIDREAARRYEASTFSIANVIRTAVYGKEVSKYKQGEDEYPIFVRLDEKYRYNIDDLLNQKITFRSPASGKISQVPISAVADIEYTSTYTSIKRKNLDRVITVYSNVIEGYNANEIVAAIGEYMEEYEMPIGFSYEFTGEQQQQAEDMAFLNTAFMVALFLIFIIIVTQFNSFISPFIIIMSVVFSTIGVFLGYAISGMDIVIIMTGVGIISLAGVVVNNAIVLIDYINLLIKRRREELNVESMSGLSTEDVRQAIINGGATRLRPVLLTAITTVLGLIPLAIGFNFNFFTLITEFDPHYFLGGDNVAFWGPMAWTVIFGLAFATFLTLIVVPVMYWLAFRAPAQDCGVV